MRTQYLANLTYKKVWLRPTDKPTTHQTCIIFDWDDTIIPTTSLDMDKLTEDQVLSTNIIKLFQQAEKYSDKVMIVTNGSYEWVNMCLDKIIPQCKDVVMKMPVFSTTDNNYGQFYEYKYWKKQA